jgi:hypothetical protein
MTCGGIPIKFPVRKVCLGNDILIQDLLKLTSWSPVRNLSQAADLTHYYQQQTHAIGHRNVNYLELFRQIHIWGRNRLQAKLKCSRKLLIEPTTSRVHQIDTISKINSSLNRVFSVPVGKVHNGWVVGEVRCDFVTHHTAPRRVTLIYIQIVLLQSNVLKFVSYWVRLPINTRTAQSCWNILWIL